MTEPEPVRSVTEKWELRVSLIDAVADLGNKIANRSAISEPSIQEQQFPLQRQGADSTQNQTDDENAEREPVAKKHEGRYHDVDLVIWYKSVK